jgi:hypothetical protein
MSHAFTRLYDGNTLVMNVNTVALFNEYCLSKESKYFFNSVYKFQRDAVLDWNAGADSMTLSFNMGFVGI